MSRYTKELLEPIIKSASSWADVCRSLGIKPATGSQTYLKSRAKYLNLDTSHFTGQGWAKGKVWTIRSIEDYLTNKFPISSDNLKKRLIREGIKEPKCEICGILEWLGAACSDRIRPCEWRSF